MSAEIVEYSKESESIYTLRLRIVDNEQRKNYRFQPGQFNMLYLHGVGEVAISIVSDDCETQSLHHTIRAVGRVTNGLEKLKPGDMLGIRGPFGNGWPMDTAKGNDIVIVTGGLGCAPVIAAITQIENERSKYGELVIIEGVRHHEDLINPNRFEHWNHMERSKVILCCSEPAAPWPWHTDRVTDHLNDMDINTKQTTAMLCGPEGMMVAAANTLEQQGICEASIYLSLERNMQCGQGLCGHCQIGSMFVCKDGPVFCWKNIRHLLAVEGL